MSDIQILRQFGPSIVKLSIPDDLLKKLNGGSMQERKLDFVDPKSEVKKEEVNNA